MRLLKLKMCHKNLKGKRLNFNHIKLPLSYLIFINILITNVKCYPLNSFDSLHSSNFELIKTASDWFNDDKSINNYEVFSSHYDKSTDETIFTSEQEPNNKIYQNGSMNLEQKIIIIPGNTQFLTVPYDKVIPYIVYRQKPTDSRKYTSHLAYVREFPDETSVEWDIFPLNLENHQESFLSAFFPIKEAQNILDLEIDQYQENNRIKRGDSDCSMVDSYLGRCSRTSSNNKSKGRFISNWQGNNNNFQGPPSQNFGNSNNFQGQPPPNPQNFNNFQGPQNPNRQVPPPPNPGNSNNGQGPPPDGNRNFQGPPNTENNFQRPPPVLPFNQGNPPNMERPNWQGNQPNPGPNRQPPPPIDDNRPLNRRPYDNGSPNRFNNDGNPNIQPPQQNNENPNWQAQQNGGKPNFQQAPPNNVNAKWQNPPNSYNNPNPNRPGQDSIFQVPQKEGKLNWDKFQNPANLKWPNAPVPDVGSSYAPNIGNYIYKGKKDSHNRPEDQQLPTTEEPRRPTPKPKGSKLEWSWKTTEQPRTNSPFNDNNNDDDIDAVTEFPMYGDTGRGNGLDDFGFTTLPPWSEYRHYEETTEMTDPFERELAANKVDDSYTKPCFDFGLQRNCGNKGSKKTAALKKACAFGYRCKDKSFLERYLVVTTTPSPGDDDDSTKGPKKSKKPETGAGDTKKEPGAGEAQMNIKEAEDNTPAVDLSSLIPGGNRSNFVQPKSDETSTQKPEEVKQEEAKRVEEEKAKKEAANPFANTLKAEAAGGTTTLPPWDDIAGSFDMVKVSTDDGDAPPENSGYVGSGFAHESTAEDDMENPDNTTRKRRDLGPEFFRTKILQVVTLGRTKRELTKRQDMLNDLEIPVADLNLPFIGVGDCSFSQPSELPHTQSHAIKFFLQILKVNCHPQFEEQTKRLFDLKLVHGPNLPRISLNYKNPLFKKKTLTNQEWEDYSSAIFLHAFSNVYTDQYEKYKQKIFETKSPDGKPLSGTIQTMTFFSLKIFDLIKSTERVHAVKLANALLISIDAQRWQNKYNLTDQNQLNILINFIIDKFPHIISGRENLNSLNQFLT